MLNDNRDVTGRLTSSGSVARSLGRFSRGATNISLPGFAELGDMVKELVEDRKTAYHNDNEFVWLATRLEDLCSLIDEFDMVEHPDVCTASRKFYEFKNSLAEGFKRRPHLGIHGVEQKQRLLDNLNREIDRIVEMTLLRLALRQTQSNKHNPIDNFQVVSAHEITDKTPVYETMYWDPPVPASKSISWLLKSGRPVVTSSAWRAHLGKAPVIYKTFSSRSDSSVAAKVAEVELKYLSRCLHPNIANMIGVTKAYDGLNGYALAADGIPLEQFLLRVNSGAALVKLVRDCADVIATMMDNLKYQIDAKYVTVKSNGHLTVFPELRKNGVVLRVSPYLGLSEDDCAALNPAVREFLTVYERYRTLHYDSLYTGFFNSIVRLDWKTLTQLEIVRLAAKHKVLPDRCNCHWPDIPPYTISVGDIGYILSQGQQDAWSPIELKRAPGIQWGCECECGHAEGGWAYMEVGQWTSITLHLCRFGHFWWRQEKDVEISYEWAKQIRASLRSDGIQVRGLRCCTGLNYSSYINRTGLIEWPFEQLYFHFNSSMRSNPQAFWGSLSTSGDPCSPSIFPGEAGLEVTHDIWYETCCLSDFWDFKYEEILQSGLASIPGSYPGSYVEVVSEDEAAETKSCVPPL